MSSRKVSKQLNLLKKLPLSYGGEILKTRKGRAHGRTLSIKDTIHLVLLSSQARGEWSFSRPPNKRKIEGLFRKFSTRYGVRICSVAYAGNHLHAQIKLATRHTYKPFIRGLTAAMAMAITGVSRWNKGVLTKHFWDYRPFTRVVRGFKAFLTLKDYIEINRLEGHGYGRDQARFLIAQDREIRAGPYAFLTES